jgi:hypothetical protein
MALLCLSLEKAVCRLSGVCCVVARALSTDDLCGVMANQRQHGPCVAVLVVVWYGIEGDKTVTQYSIHDFRSLQFFFTFARAVQY